MDTIYFDWSQRTGVYMLRNDDVDHHIYPTLDALLDDLEKPHRLVGEATFESFDLRRRAKVIDRAAAEGHELLTTPTRLTGKHRRRMGIPDSQKNDATDVRVIRDLANSGRVHLKRPVVHRTGDVKALREDANAELRELRRQGYYQKKPRSEGYKFVSDKETWAQELAYWLPPLVAVEKVGRRTVATPINEKRYRALGDGRGYNLTIVAAVGMAAKHARTTREFDRLAGLYAHAYGSQIRADLHHYGWAGGNGRGKLITPSLGENQRAVRRDGLTFSEYRRELRWLYHQLRKLPHLDGTSRPENGISHPRGGAHA